MTDTTQAQPEPEKEVMLTLTVTETNVILAALDELPHKHSRKVIDKVIEQAQAQLKQAE